MATSKTKIEVEVVADASQLERTFRRAGSSAQGFNSDLSHAERGALAGSGAFRGLGRSIAFASGGFLAFASAGQFIRSSIDAAVEAGVTQRQLGVQLRNNGKNFADYRAQIDKTNLRLSTLSGFTKDQLDASLTTILRTTGNVSKALRDNATAADLARARHIGLAQAAFIIAKVEAGNTTLLRRQGFEIKKNATAEEALAVVRAKVAGQARAGATEQERFGATLHDSQVIIGTALLPTLNRYLIAGTKWLQQMNESGKLQKDVSTAAKDFASIMGDVKSVVKGVDDVTGSFKHTLELLLALKVASWAGGITRSLGGLTGGFGRATTATGGLSKSLAGGDAALAAQAGVASFALTTLTLKATGLDKTLKSAGGSAQSFFSHIPGFNKGAAPLGLAGPSFTSSGGTDKPGQIGGVNVNDVIGAARKMLDAGRSADGALQGLEKRFVSLSKDDLQVLLQIAEKMQETYRAAGGVAAEAGAKAAHGLALAASQVQTQAASAVAAAESTKKALTLTAAQRNTFFDNDIARILRRGALGNLQQQLAAIDDASSKIQAKLKATRDKTRRLNLQDQLLELGSERKSIKQQVAQNLKERIDAENQAAKDLAQKRKDIAAAQLASLTSREFRQLGLSSTGDPVTPGVTNLRKRVSQITQNISGTSLDTPKLESQLARFRRVLSEGLVPKDVRAKIKEMLDSISDEIKNAVDQNQTKFRHLSSVAAAASIAGLTPDQKRKVEQLFAQVGAGGTIPQQSAAFAKAGAQTVVVHNYNVVDGKVVSKTVTKHQQTAASNRSGSRRGPYAGRH